MDLANSELKSNIKIGALASVVAVLFFNFMLSSIKAQEVMLAHIEKMRLYDRDVDQIFDKSIGYTNYDVISEAIRNFESELGALKSEIEDGVVLSSNKSISRDIEALNSLVTQKSRVAERYKSSNSIVNNSLYYMFSLNEQITKFSLKKKGVDDSLLEAMGEIITLLYVNNRNTYQNIEEYREKLLFVKSKIDTQTVDENLHSMLKLFVLHGEKILKYRENITTGIELQKKQEVAVTLDRLKGEINSSFAEVIELQKVISYILFSITILFFVALLYFYIKEERLKKELFRKNIELKERYEELVSNKAKQRAQEEILIQQSKMAAMGEMIGVIAHQWKQPLNALTLQLQLLLTLEMLGELTKEELRSRLSR